jgi:hypothetical protein
VNIAKSALLLQVVYGEGIANYMQDGGADIAPDQTPPGAAADAVPTLGWLAYLNHTWTDELTSSIGFSEHRQFPLDGQTDTAFEVGQYGNVNILYHPIPEMFVGPEFVFGRRQNNNGDDGMDMRVSRTRTGHFAGATAVSAGAPMNR